MGSRGRLRVRGCCGGKTRETVFSVREELEVRRALAQARYFISGFFAGIENHRGVVWDWGQKLA